MRKILYTIAILFIVSSCSEYSYTTTDNQKLQISMKAKFNPYFIHNEYNADENEGKITLLGFTIPDYLFENCQNLLSVTIGFDCKRIGEGAFKGCTSLKSVYIGDGSNIEGSPYMFDGNAYNRKIYSGSYRKYSALPYWSDYKYDFRDFNYYEVH